MVDQPDDDFLDNRHDDQKHQESESAIHGRQISGLVVLFPPILIAWPISMNLASTIAMTMAIPQGTKSTPWVCSTAVFIKITAPIVMYRRR